MQTSVRWRIVQGLALATGAAFSLASGMFGGGTETPESLVAAGEAFQNLTVVSEKMAPAYSPVVSPDGQKLVFVSTKDGNEDLYLKPNPTGAAVQKLTTHGAADVNPAFSPDGKRIAFATKRSGNFDIFILSAEGGTAKQQVTDSQEDEFFPSWSPDGRLIAYARFSNIDGQFYIWTKHLETGANTQLGPGTLPQFSPDGKRILFQKAGQTGNRWYSIWVMNDDGGNLTQLTPDEDWGAIDAVWSPDGKRIAFVSSKGTSGQIITVSQENSLEKQVIEMRGNNLWVINAADGAGLTQLTTHKADDWRPFWASTNHLYFTSTRDGETNIWRFTPVLPDGYVPAVAAPAAELAPADPSSALSGTTL